jgi:hypothetical protein
MINKRFQWIQPLLQQSYDGNDDIYQSTIDVLQGIVRRPPLQSSILLPIALDDIYLRFIQLLIQYCSSSSSSGNDGGIDHHIHGVELLTEYCRTVIRDVVVNNNDSVVTARIHYVTLGVMHAYIQSINNSTVRFTVPVPVHQLIHYLKHISLGILI